MFKKNIRSQLLIVITSALSVAAAAHAGTRPNIVFVMADDMGTYDIGAYGQKEIHTPHLDRMAAEGIRFTAAYAGGSVCAPSRSVLMTGQHLGHTRVRGNGGIVGGVLDHNNMRRVPLEPEDVTLAQVLKARGYVTAMAGKWGLGEAGTSGEPNLKGFDEWFGFLNQNHAHTHYPDYLWHNQQRVTIEPNVNGRRQQHSHELFTNFALDFIRRNSGRPFFLYLPYTLPHREMAVPTHDPYTDKPWTDEEKIHASMINMIDQDMGRLFKLLAELRIDGNTIVFFTSDNGAARRYDGRFDCNGPLRDRKGSLYEGGLRVPMIVRWPGNAATGSTSDLPWTFADVMPTLAELSKAAIPPNIDGVSVLPAILGERQQLQRMLYWEQGPGGAQRAVRWGRWKGIRDPGKPFELYDLDADPGETTNVAGANAEVVRRIEAFMISAHLPSPNWPADSPPRSRTGTPKKKS